MVHTKYTRKGDKTYGPYLYENKRVGGQVKTSYLGKHKPKKKSKSWVFILIGIFVVLGGLFFFFYDPTAPTGRVAFEVELDSYVIGELLTGDFRVRVRSGELIPGDSVLSIDYGDQSKTLALSELVDDEMISGEFYAEDTSVSGEGEGYGVIGSRATHPTIGFEIEVFSSSEESSGGGGGGEIDVEVEEEDEDDEESEEDEEEESEEESEEEESEEDEEGEEESGEESGEDEGGEDSSDDGEDSGGDEGGDSGGDDGGDSGGDSGDGGGDGGDGGDAGITGSVIRGITGSVISAYAVSGDGQIVSGSVSKDNDFEYDLEAGQNARIVSGSVNVDGEEIPDSSISLNVGGGRAVVSTDYFVNNPCFGEDCLGEYALTLYVPISEFELVAEETQLTISLISLGEEISTFTEYVSVTGIEEAGEETEATEETETGVEGTNVTVSNETTVETNETIIETNITEANVTTNVTSNITISNETGMVLLGDIPTVRIPFGESVAVDLRDYIFGADSYVLDVDENIIASFEEHVMTLTPAEGFKGAKRAKIIASNELGSLESNEFLILVSSGAVRIKTSREKIVVGEKVKWKKNVTLDGPENITVEIPDIAENLTVTTITEGGSEETEEIDVGSLNSSGITGGAVVEFDLGKETPGTKVKNWLKDRRNGVVKFFKNIFKGGVTGRVVDEGEVEEESGVIEVPLDDPEAEEYIVEYETPAPEKEEVVEAGKKIVTISGPDDVEYTDVIAFTELGNTISVAEIEILQVYWRNYEYDELSDAEIAEAANKDPDEVEDEEVVEETEEEGETIGEVVDGSFDVTIEEETVEDNETQEPVSEPNETEESPVESSGEEESSEEAADLEIEFTSFTGGAVAVDSEEEVELAPAINESSNESAISGVTGNIEVAEEVVVAGYVLQEVAFDAYDLDGDGFIDYVEWVVPHLSAQSYEITIGPSIHTPDTNITLDGNYTHLTINAASAPYDSLRGYWSFDADENSTAYDFSSYEHDGTYTSGAYTGAGLYDKAAIFDGDDDNINVGDESNLDLINFTMAAWIYPREQQLESGMVMRKFVGGTPGEGYYMIVPADEDVYCYVRTQDGARNVRIVAAAAQDTWHHVACTYNGTTLAPYSDGVAGTPSVGVYNETISPAGNNFNIGGFGSSYNFNGSVDEVMIFSEALTAAQISAIYQNTSSRFVPEGDFEFSQFNITSNEQTLDLNFSDYSRLHGSNISLRVGEWHSGIGYNTSDFSGSNGLVAYFLIDEANWGGIGQTDAENEVTNAKQLCFPHTLTQANYPYRRYATFSGSQVCQDDGSGAINGADTGTLSVWIKRLGDGSTAWEPVLTEGGGTAGYFINTNCNDNNVQFGVRSSNAAVFTAETSNSIIKDDKWHHLVGVYDTTANTVKLYVDGVEKASAAASTTVGDPGNGIDFGGMTLRHICDRDTTDGFFNGHIDEAMAWTRALSAAEIKELYVKGRALWNYNVAYQNLTGNSGDTVSNNQFSVSSSTTNVLPSLKMTSGTNRFYTPLLAASTGAPADVVGYDPCSGPISGQTWTIGASQSCTFTDTTVNVNEQNVDISGTLKLVNTILILNASGDGGVNVTINSGGTLNITQGSNVTDGTGGGAYGVHADGGSKFQATDSFLENAGWGATAGPAPGFYIESAGALIRNCTVDRAYQVYYRSVVGGIIEDNLFINSPQDGLILQYGSYSKLYRNVFYNNQRYGVYPATTHLDAQNNTITGVNDNIGIIYARFGGTPKNNTFRNTVFNGSFVIGAVDMYQADGLLIVDSNISNSYSTGEDLYVDQIYDNYNFTFRNVTYKDEEWENTGANGTFIREWYLDVFANYSNNSIATNVNVNVTNVSGTVVNVSTTGATGYSPRLTLQEYTRNATDAWFRTNYTVTVYSDAGLSASKQINLTNNFVDGNFYVTMALADSAAPNTTITHPLDGTYFASGDFPIYLNVTLGENGSAMYSLDSGTVNITMTGDEGGAFGTKFNATNASMSDGYYTMNVYANDTTGNNNYTESVGFGVDSVTPTVSFTGDTPENAAVRYAGAANVNLTTSDSNDHYSFVDWQNDVLLWWRFDDTSGTETVVDLSSYSNNGTMNGSASLVEMGQFGDSVYLTGGYNAVVGKQQPVENTAHTISCWVKPKALSSKTILKQAGDDVEDFTLRIDDASGHLEIQKGSLTPTKEIDYYTTSTLTVAANAWSHVVFVFYNSSTGRFYVNGVGEWIDVNAIDSFISEGERNFTIGNDIGTTIDGYVDEVIVINRTISDAEALALYNSSANKYNYNFTGLTNGNSYSYTGHVVDKSGNRADTGARSVVIDTIEPYVNFTGPMLVNGSTAGGTSIFVNLTSSDLHDHYSFVDMNNDVLLWMRMDDVDGSGNPTDLSSWSNNGTKMGTAAQNVSGYYGAGFSFDGNSDYINVSTLKGFAMERDNVTGAAWIKMPTAISGTDTIMSGMDPGGLDIDSSGGAWSLYANSNEKIVFQISEWGTVTSNTVLNDGAWHHVVFTLDSSIENASIYVDGAIDVSGTISDNAGTDSWPVLIGAIYSTGSPDNYFSGSIDDVLIVNRTLKSDEVKALYNATSDKYEYNFTGLGDGTYVFRGSSADVAGNKNQTGYRSVTVSVDSASPTWANNKTNLTASTAEGDLVYFNVTFTETNPDMYIFSWFNGSAWTNTTGSYTSGTPIKVEKNISIDIASINWTWFGNDTAGNTNQTDVWSIALVADDATAPLVTINLPTTERHYSISSVIFNITLNEAGSCRYSLDGGTNNVTMTNNGNVNFNATNSSIADASYTMDAYCNDTAGNTNYTETVRFKVDTVEPYVNFTSPMPVNGSTETGSGIYVNVTSSDLSDHYVFTEVDNDLLGWWRLDQNLVDETGEHNGTASGDPAATNSSYYGQAYEFDGNDNINCGNNTDLNIRNNFTISAWFKPTNYNAHGTIVAKSYDATWESFVLQRGDNNNTVFAISSSGSVWDTSLTGTTHVESNVWHHVVVTQNATEATMYLNGVEEATDTSPGVPGDSAEYDFYIGRREGSGGQYFVGSIDEVIVLNRSLSSSEAQALYNATANKYYNNFTTFGDGTYVFKGYSVDRAGNKNETGYRSVTLDSSIGTNVTACGTINSAGTYILDRDISTTGTCIKITAGDVWFEGQGYNIDGDEGENDYGFYVESVTNVTINNTNITDFGRAIYFNNTNDSFIKNNDIYSNKYGIYAETSSSNQFQGGVIHSSTDDAIFLTGTSSNNEITSLTVNNTNSSTNDLNINDENSDNTVFTDVVIKAYSFAGAGAKITVKDTDWGEVKFLTSVNGSGSNFTGEGVNNTWDDIIFKNGSITVDTSGNSGLNGSANITLYNVGDRGFRNPRILRNGVICTECRNFTALTDDNITFNISYWSWVGPGNGTYSPHSNKSGDWTNPENAYEEEIIGGKGAAATANTVGDAHDFTEFQVETDLLVPSGYAVSGLIVKLDGGIRSRYCLSPPVEPQAVNVTVSLSWDNGATFTGTKKNEFTCGHWGDDEVFVYGGKSDKWGHDWTADELNDTNFVLRVNYSQTNDAGLTMQLDHIKLDVWTQNVTISNCTELITANLEYNLTGDISTTGDCIAVSADNITINGKGYFIKDTDGGSNRGVYANGSIDGLTVKHLNISGFNIGVSMKVSANNSFIWNNTIEGGTSINFQGGSHNVVENNTLSPGNYAGGVEFAGTAIVDTGNNVTGNTITTDGQYGVYMKAKNGLIKNNVVSGENQGISLYGENNKIINNSVTGAILAIAVSSGGNNNQFINNTINRPTQNGIQIYNAYRNTFEGGSINGSKQSAIYLDAVPGYAAADNNNFTNIVITNTNLTYYDFEIDDNPPGGGIPSIANTYLIDMAIANYSFGAVTRGEVVHIKDSIFGEIRFLASVNGTGTNLSNDIRIGNNSVTVLSDNNKGLNYSANITLYGIGGRGFTQPTILRDGAACGDCTNFTALTATDVLFKVTAWTNYSIGEGDTTYPTWTNNKTNLTASTAEGDLVYFNVTLTETNPDMYIFSWFNGSVWANTTGSYTSGTPIEVEKTINIDIASINWTWFGNDSVGNVNQTDVWSIALVADDATSPLVTINLPTTTNYSSSSVVFNVTLNENGYCEYSLDSGVTNVTMQNNGNVNFNHTNSSLGDGTYTMSAYCNDTAGNANYTESVLFGVDATYPLVSIVYPIVTNYSSARMTLNYTASDARDLDSCWYTVNSGETNTTITCGNNVTGLNSGEGSSTWTVWVNDTADNTNSSSVTFNVDSISPNLSIIYPTNASTVTDVNIEINYSISADAQTCWWTNSSGETNKTIVCGTNITGQTWDQGSNYVIIYANDSANNLNSSSVTFTVDSISPLLSFGVGTENDEEKVDTEIYVNVTVTETNEDAITFRLYNTTAEVNVTSFTDGTRTINWTGLSADTYTYNVTVNDTAGNSNSTSSQSVAWLASCLSQCTEGSDCTISSDCVLHNSLCSGSICDFDDLIINSQIYTLYGGRGLAINLSGNITFGSYANVSFVGKRGTNIGTGSAGGNAGVVNITVTKLFNTTNARFQGYGGFGTGSSAGGTGGTFQINYHGLIRNFSLGTAIDPNVTGGGGGSAGTLGDIIYVKDSVCPRDADVTGDGRFMVTDAIAITSRYNNITGDGTFSEDVDITCDGKINVADLVRVGWGWNTR